VSDSSPPPDPGSAAAASPTPGEPGAALASAASTPRGRSFPTLVVVAVAVGVIAFVAGVVAGTTIHAPASSGSSSSAALTYGQAKDLSDPLAANRGGTWEESAVIGIASPAAGFYPPSGSEGCVLPGFYIPAYEGSLAAGVAPFWLFVYLQDPSAYAPAELVVTVVNGSAHALVEYPQGTACTDYLNATDVVTGSVTNSPIAASNASETASAYLEAETGVTAVYELEPGAPVNWTVGYSPCGVVPGGTNESGIQPTEVVTLTASTGALASTRLSTATCVSKRPYVVELSQGATGTLLDGAYYDNLTVSIDAPLPVANLIASIETPDGGPVYPANQGCFSTNFPSCPDPTFGWYLVLSSGGSVEESFSVPSTPGSWTETSGSAITDLETGETLSILSASQLSGTQDLLGLVGLGGSTVVSQTTL
jgi:hypothetical protein